MEASSLRLEASQKFSTNLIDSDFSILSPLHCCAERVKWNATVDWNFRNLDPIHKRGIKPYIHPYKQLPDFEDDEDTVDERRRKIDKYIPE